jgi:hypothetical protein
VITTQDIAQQAAADPKVGRFVLDALAALKSPNPIASFEWLASVEPDPDRRFGFETAAGLVRAREAR